MLAATLAEPGRIEFGQVPDPELNESAGAIVRVTRAGICGSDLYLYDGRIDIEPEFALGHEYVGVVEEVGPDVRLIEAGARVTGSFSASCGRCGACQSGQHARCLLLRFFGFGFAFGDLPGGQAERIFVPEADLTLREVPDEITDDVAVLLGDNVVTAVDVLRRGRFQPGQVVAVLGAGATGLLTAHAALALGAAAVVVHDTVQPRLDARGAARRDRGRRLEDRRRRCGVRGQRLRRSRPRGRGDRHSRGARPPRSVLRARAASSP